MPNSKLDSKTSTGRVYGIDRTIISPEQNRILAMLMDCARNARDIDRLDASSGSGVSTLRERCVTMAVALAETLQELGLNDKRLAVCGADVVVIDDVMQETCRITIGAPGLHSRDVFLNARIVVRVDSYLIDPMLARVSRDWNGIADMKSSLCWTLDCDRWSRRASSVHPRSGVSVSQARIQLAPPDVHPCTSGAYT